MEMPQSTGPGPLAEFIYWAMGGIATFFAIVANFINGKVESRVHKDVFKEFKQANQDSHHRTHHQLDEIKVNQQKLFDRMDGKQDK